MAINKADFAYQWSEAADPFGWLYGAVIIAAESALRCFAGSGSRAPLAWGCLFVGFVSLLLLVAAMTERGATSSWKPTGALKVFAMVLVGAILCMGFIVHTP